MENASVPFIKKSLISIYRANKEFYKDVLGQGCAVIYASIFVLYVIGVARINATPEMGVLDIAFKATYSFFVVFWILTSLYLTMLTVGLVGRREGEMNSLPTYEKNYLENRKNGKYLLAVVFRFLIAISVAVLLGWVGFTAEQEVGGIDFLPARFFASVFLCYYFYFMFTLLMMILEADELTYPSIRSFWNRRVKPQWQWRVWQKMAAWFIPLCLVGAVSATAIGVLVANLRGYM